MEEDIKLVLAVRTGDERAFEKLFFKYYEPLCHFACRYVYSMHIAEELVQDLFANLWEARAILTTTGNFRSYLYQSVKNQALDHLKHQEIVQKYEEEVEIRLYNQVYEQNDEEITKDGFIDAVRLAIEELPQRSRQIYKLSRTDGFTYPEIAEILGTSIKTVEYHISKALSILRERLAHFLPALLLVQILYFWAA